jgi:hypothetical protein
LGLRSLGLVLALSQLACLDSLLESPLILATNLGSINGLAPSPRDSLLVATEQGLWEVDVEGGRQRLSQRAAQDVSTLPEQVVLLSGGVLSWGPYPEKGEPLQLDGRFPAPGVRCIQAWFDKTVILAEGNRLSRLDLDSGRLVPWGSLDDEILDLGLGGHSASAPALVHTKGGLHRVREGESEKLLVPSGAQVPEPIHGATLDTVDRLWVVHGKSGTLSIDSGKGLTEVARDLGEPRSMTMGGGGLTPMDSLFMATSEGTLEYIRVPLQ